MVKNDMKNCPWYNPELCPMFLTEYCEKCKGENVEEKISEGKVVTIKVHYSAPQCDGHGRHI